MFYLADPVLPVWEHTRSAQLEEPDVVLIDGLVDRMIVTTQTCDIGEEDAAKPVKPFAQISPVYDASSRRDLNLLRKGKGPAYLLYLPEVEDGFFVADFRIELPVEKGWLSQQPITKGFPTEDGQAEVGRRLARLRERPAFSRRFLEHIASPLLDALTALRKTNRPQFDRITEHIAQVRALVDSRLNTTTAQLFVVGDKRIPGDVVEWFRNWWDDVNPIALAGGITLQTLRIVTWDEMTAREYNVSGELNLARWSPD